MKWSDGEPFTVDDIIFFFEDWKYNADLYPATQAVWMLGGDRFGIERIDDYNIRFTFAEPYPSFSVIHFSGAPTEPFRPAHYLRQFHPTYNPNVAAEATAAGFNSWQAYFTLKADGDTDSPHYGVSNPDMPVLSPWIPVSNDSQRQQYERNPYYFKVDTEGNQLPYIDTMTVEYTSNAEVMNLKAVSGELSVAGLDIQLLNFPIIRRGEEAGGYTTKLVYSERGADVALAFNPLHPDPVLAALYADVKFRQALSIGINRSEINELVFLGQGTPRQATVNETASFFDPAWASHYAQFDVEAANAMLDELGLDKRDGQGVRLRPDGQPLSFQLEYLPQEGPKKEVCELVVKHWQALGLQVDAAARERGYLIQRLDAQEQHATAWHVDRVLERPAYAYSLDGKLGPGGNSVIRYAREWQNWFNSNGERGVEPPQDAKDLREAYLKWQKTELGTPEYEAAAKAVFDLTAETLYVIGVVGQAPAAHHRAQRHGKRVQARRRHPPLVGRGKLVLAHSQARAVVHQNLTIPSLTRIRVAFGRPEIRQPEEPRRGPLYHPEIDPGDPDRIRDLDHLVHHHPAAARRLSDLLHCNAGIGWPGGRSGPDRCACAPSTVSVSRFMCNISNGSPALWPAISAILSSGSARWPILSANA